MEQIYDSPGYLPVTTYIWQIALILLGAFVLGYVLRLLLNESMKHQLIALQNELADLQANEQRKIKKLLDDNEDNSVQLKKTIQDLNDKLSRCYVDRVKLETQLSKSNAKLTAMNSEDASDNSISGAQTKTNTIEQQSKLESSATQKTSYKKDDFKRIEGIGPKIEEILKSSGLTSYTDLINATVDDIRTALKQAGPTYAVHDPSTWAEQAQLAKNGKWNELSSLQEDLKGGKRT